MTVEHGEPRAEHDDPPADPSAERDRTGKFIAGNLAARGNTGGGRRRGASISSELRRLVDPERIATYLRNLVEDPRANHREKLEACKLILDRLEGRAVSRSITASADRLLPAGFHALDPTQQLAALRDIRARALAGALEAGPLVIGDEDA